MIELIVVVTLISILTAVGVVSYVGTRGKARDERRKIDLQLVRAALEMYKADHSGEYPDENDWDNLGTEIGQYLADGMPSDPSPNVDWREYAYGYNSTSGKYCIRACMEEETTDTTNECAGYSVLGCGGLTRDNPYGLESP